MEEEARPGSPHLPTLQTDKVDFYEVNTTQTLLRKEENKKKSLPLNDVGCISYLTVDWISSTMWKAFRVSN